MFLQAPNLIGVSLPRYILNWLGRLAPDGRCKLLWRLFSGRSRISRFTIVSHHFMSQKEIESPLGQERIDHCVFCVPVDGKLVFMCEFNATGGRGKFYQQVQL